MPLRAGTKKKIEPNDDWYVNSMAEAMEKAFIQEWPIIMKKEGAAPQPNDHMRLLFIAIAQGVVQHLQANQAAITVPSIGAAVNIDVEEEPS